MEIVLLIIVAQQGLFALAWGLAGWRLGLSRRASIHWTAGTLLVATSLALILARGEWPDLLTKALANFLAVAAFVATRRGLQIFLRLRTTDREHLALLAVALLAMVWLALDPGLALAAATTVSALIAWSLMRAAFEAHHALRRSEGRRVALGVALSFALLGAVYLARVGVGLASPEGGPRPLDESSAFNDVLALVFVVAGLSINMAMAYMVANRLVRRLHRLSLRDPLTGVLNRRGLNMQLMREAVRLRRYREAYAVLVADVDHFKALNDRHGHAAGDAALVALAEVLRRSARNIDQVARIGGEEFCLLLPHTDRAGALAMAERVREAVQAAPWPHLDQPLTVSVGVALGDQANELPDAVLKRADVALYGAKGQGRNRVVLAGPALSAAT